MLQAGACSTQKAHLRPHLPLPLRARCSLQEDCCCDCIHCWGCGQRAQPGTGAAHACSPSCGGMRSDLGCAADGPSGRRQPVNCSAKAHLSCTLYWEPAARSLRRWRTCRRCQGGLQGAAGLDLSEDRKASRCTSARPHRRAHSAPLRSSPQQPCFGAAILLCPKGPRTAEADRGGCGAAAPSGPLGFDGHDLTCGTPCGATCTSASCCSST